MSVNGVLDIEAQVTTLTRLATKLAQYESTSTNTEGAEEAMKDWAVSDSRKLIEQAISVLSGRDEYNAEARRQEIENDDDDRIERDESFGIVTPSGNGFKEELG